MVTKYIDYNRGNDSNDGSSPELAWKNLTKIDDAAYTAGDTFYLADDSIWEYDLSVRVLPPNTWTGTRENPVTIKKYSPSGVASMLRPTIRWNRKLLTTDWVYDAPNNAWYYDAPFNIGNYCLVRINNSWFASRTDDGLPLSSIKGRYHNNNTRFYLYAPSHINPTSYYGEVLLGISGTGFFSISNQRGFVKFEDLRAENMGTLISGYSDTAFDVGIIVRNIQGKTISSIVTAVTTGINGQLYADIQGVTVDDWGSTVIWGYTQNGAGMKQFDVSGLYITDGMHNYSQGAVYCQVRSSGLIPKIFNNYFRGTRFGTNGKTLDGCCIYGEVNSGGLQVYQNTFEDCYLPITDNSGRNNSYFSNLALNCKSFIRIDDATGVGSMDLNIYNNTAIVGANLSPSYGNGVSEAGIRCYRPTGTIVGLKIRNNCIINIGEVQTAAILTPKVTPGVSSYGYNIVYGYTEVAKMELTPFTIEPSPGSSIQNPFLTFTQRPTEDSPLISSGIYLESIKDNNSNTYWNPPTIGAFEYIRPRTAASTRTMRT